MPSFRSLVRRRVPQYVAVYLGAGWGLVEFVSFLEGRYSIAPAWTDLSLLVWALLIPSVVLYTYHHGRPGKDAWARSELIVIPLNLAVVVFVLGIALSSRDLSATTHRLTVVDETGATEHRVVARPQYRKRLALFYLEAAPSDTSVQWLREAIPSALAVDLGQDVFLDVRIPLHFRPQLASAGFAEGHGLPAAAMRRIAQDLHLPYFVTGRVATAADGVAITLVVHEAATGKRLRDRTASGPDFLALVDELSVQVKQDLRVPPSPPGALQDLDLVELLSSNPAAVRAAMEAQSATGRDDWELADRLYARAVELDPTFALAHFSLYQVRTVRGRSQAARPSLAAALQYDFRLPERIRFLARVEHFVAQQDMEKAYAVAKMMTDLYPDELHGYSVRAQVELYRGDRTAAIATLRRVLEVDAQQHEVLLQIGSLQEQNGEFDEALHTYATYAERFPRDASAQARLARAHQATGDPARAREALDRALLLDPTSMDVMVDLAALQRNSGELADAYRRLEQARAMAHTAQDRARLQQGLRSYHLFRGQHRQALRATEALIAALTEFQPPAVVRSQEMRLLGDYVKAGDRRRAERLLEQIREGMREETHEFWRIGQLAIAVETRDTVQLREGIRGVRSLIEGFGFQVLEPEVLRAEGVLHEARGAWSDALRSYLRLRELEPSSTTVAGDIARAYRMVGRPEDALKALDADARRVPYAPQANMEAARVRLALGDVDAARVHLARVAAVWAEAEDGFGPAAELRELLGRAAPR